MKHNNTLSLLLGLTLAFTAGCNKDDREETPEPRSEPAVNYSRSIVYHDNGPRRDTTFQVQQLEAYANQDAQNLAIGVHPAATTEGIGFVLNRVKLSATLTGTYTLNTLRDRTRDADVTYYYDLPESLGGGTILYFNNAQHLTGNLTITGYDTKRQLLNGTYTTTLEGASDPTVPYTTFPKRKCDITITGTFTNIPLKSIE